MSQSYAELTQTRTDLEQALADETDPQIVDAITEQINDVKAQIEEYDLSDDDLFQCELCDRVDDIDNSHRMEGKRGPLICDVCHTKAGKLFCCNVTLGWYNKDVV